ncbi:MAG: tetratricopeptide repeat protein [Burkholderiaceae bacterium]|nr:tetratricopeptide repeat protein [Burkholderiaceae bacterium]
MNDPLHQAREHFRAGVEHFEAGRLDAALECFEAALALAPGRASVLANLGITLAGLGRWAEAIDPLQRATASDARDADAWLALGRCRAQLGKSDDALDAFDHALAIDAGLAQAWSERGSLLRELGRLDEARESYERALALGADRELHRYYLASVSGERAPAAPPRAYVEALFEQYAGEFDAHLRHALRYRAPETLVAPLLRDARRYRSVLDLGCGSGLCGALIRPLADKVCGVDLSEAMLAQARARAVYDELHRQDIAAFLAESARGADLVLAADVFIYVGELSGVFASVRRVLVPGGCFALTVELCADSEDLRLLPSLRYAHSRAYLLRLAREHGFSLRESFVAPLREEQRRAVDGLYLYLG